MIDSVDLLLDQLEKRPHVNPTQLGKLKGQVAKQSRAPLLRNDIVLDRYRQQVKRGVRPFNPLLECSLVLNSVRTAS